MGAGGQFAARPSQPILSTVTGNMGMLCGMGTVWMDGTTATMTTPKWCTRRIASCRLGTHLAQYNGDDGTAGWEIDFLI